MGVAGQAARHLGRHGPDALKFGHIRAEHPRSSSSGCVHHDPGPHGVRLPDSGAFPTRNSRINVS